MTNKKRVFIGGLGALTPVIMNLLVVDLEITFQTISAFVIIGYLLRVIILFYLGGLIAYLHKDEKNAFKLFELGIVAPALVTGFLNAANIDVHSSNAHLKTAVENASNAMFFPGSAQAFSQEPNKESVKTFPSESESKSAQFWRGFVGKKNDHNYFVIAADNLSLEEARKRAKAANAKKNDMTAHLYKSKKYSGRYTVVIGEYLSEQEAGLLREKAKKAGFEKSVIWHFDTKEEKKGAKKSE